MGSEKITRLLYRLNLARAALRNKGSFKGSRFSPFSGDNRNSSTLMLSL